MKRKPATLDPVSAVDPRTQATLAPTGVRVLMGLAEERGIAVHRLCRGLGISQEALSQESFLVSYQQTRALILRVQRELDEPALGLAVGARETPISWGLAGLAMLTCETLGEAVSYGLERQEHTGALMQHLLIEQEDRFHLTATPHIFDMEIEPFLVEESFAGAVAITRAMVGTGFRPLQVDFAYACPAKPHIYERFFRCPVRFDAYEHRLTVDKKWMQVRLPGYERFNSDLVRMQLNQLLKVPIGQDDLLTTVVSRFRYGLQDASSQQHLATQVNLSERTLRRRLAQRDVSYRALRDETRYEKAKDLLLNTRMSVAEVAQALGYADARSFRRAFKRWSGVLPTALRVGSTKIRTLES